MAAYCEICHKGVMSGMNVSHSHIRTKRKWEPNIQHVRVRAVADGEVKRVNICTRCLRSIRNGKKGVLKKFCNYELL